MKNTKTRFLLAIVLLWLTQASLWSQALFSGQTPNHEFEIFNVPNGPVVWLPKTAILPEQLAIIVNTDDPISHTIATYYANARGIPAQNIIPVSLGTRRAILSEANFLSAMNQINQALAGKEDSIQAFLLAWKGPNFFSGAPHIGGAAGSSVAAAFAKGALLENPGASSGRTQAHHHRLLHDFFNSNSTTPYTDFGIRPTMHLMTGENTVNSIMAMIDKGVSSDATFPTGDGYYIHTQDRIRNTRWPSMEEVPNQYTNMNLQALDLRDSLRDFLFGTSDILFYFTGKDLIQGIATNQFLPGAIADHMTSSGGVIANNGQTFIGEWMDAGATASYGTVTEPTNSVNKFPNPELITREYFQGGSTLGSYWKSVRDPSQGYFVGDPLARPFKPKVVYENDVLNITASFFEPGLYYLAETSTHPYGSWKSVLAPIKYSKLSIHTFNIQNPNPQAIYRVVPDYVAPTAPTQLSARFVPDSVLLPCKKEVPHVSLSFNPATDNTGEIANYRVYIDGKPFTTYDASQGLPAIRIGYSPGVYQKKPNEVTLTAIDRNGNESVFSQTLTINIPEYRAFGFEVQLNGRINYQTECPPNYQFPLAPTNLSITAKPDSILEPCQIPIPHLALDFTPSTQGAIYRYNLYIDGQLFTSKKGTRNGLDRAFRIGYDPTLPNSQIRTLQVTAVDIIGNESPPTQLKVYLSNYHPFGHLYMGQYIPHCPNIIGASDPRPTIMDMSTEPLELVAFPNPFQEHFQIALNLPQDTKASLRIVNNLGQLIWQKELNLPQGQQTLYWDGRDANQQKVPDGIYYLEVQTGHRVTTKAMLKTQE